MTDSTERRKPENRLDEKIATPTRKPFMTPTQLVAALKVRGVTFEWCSEGEAADYLAHANSCIINGFSVTSERADFPTSNPIAASMNERGLKSSKSRRSKMRNLRVTKIAAVLFALSEFCRRESTRAPFRGNGDRPRGVRCRPAPLPCRRVTYVILRFHHEAR